MGIRGEIFTGNTATGEVTNITKTGRAVERNPVWSPDGKWIAYFSDESGEMELHLQTAPVGAVRRVPIEKKSSHYSELQWSPDSKKLVFSDSHLALWCYELEKKRPVASTMPGTLIMNHLSIHPGRRIAPGSYMRSMGSIVCGPSRFIRSRPAKPQPLFVVDRATRLIKASLVVAAGNLCKLSAPAFDSFAEKIVRSET